MALPPDLDDDLARIRRRRSEVTAKGGQAFLRRLLLAEHHDSGQAKRAASSPGRWQHERSPVTD